MAVVYYDRLMLKKAQRRVQHLTSPRILDANTFSFPVGSVFHWWTVSEDIAYFSNDYGYMQENDKVVVETIMDQKVEHPLGRTTPRSALLNAIISENAKKCKAYRFLKKDQKIKVMDKTLKVYNYGPLNARVKYPTQILRTYNIFYNTFSSVINNLFLDESRHIFLILDMPTNIPNRMLMNKFANTLRNQHLEILNTYQHLTFLELWKLITPELRTKSIFNNIPKEKYDKVNLLFHLDNKLLLFNLNTLMSCVKEYGIETPMQAKPAEEMKKKIHLMITKFITNPAMSDQELEHLEKVIEANPNLEDVSNIQIKEEETGESINSKSIFHKLISRHKKQKEHLQEVDNEINEELDTVYEDIEDDGTEEDDDELEKHKIAIPAYDDVNSMLEENISDDENDIIDTVDDSANYELLSMENELANDSKAFENMEELLNEEYRYDNVKNKIEYLKENKLLSNKNANDLLGIMEKALNKKDPYGSDDTISKVLDDTDDDTTISQEEYAITDNKVVFDKKYNNNITNVVRQDYIAKQYKKDVLRSVYSIQNGNAIVTDYNIENVENLSGSIEKHTISIKTLDNKTHNVSLVLPKLLPNGEMKLSNNTYIMRYQRAAIPINKISATEVKLSSYYGNLFIAKANYKKDDVGYYVMNKLAKRYKNNEGIENLIMLPSNNKDMKVPLDYAQFSRYIKSFKYKEYTFYFEYKKRQDIIPNLSTEELHNIEKGGRVLIGTKGKLPLVMSNSNMLATYSNGKYTEISNIYELIELDTIDNPIEYSIIKKKKHHIPTVIPLSYYLSLYGLMRLLKLKYEIIADVGTRVPKSDKYYVVKFKDVKLKVYRDFDKGDMIVSGLLSIENILKEVNIKCLNNKNDFAILFNRLNYSLAAINEIKMLEGLFVDPMTLQILKDLKFPTAFKGLLIKANEMLVDDNYQNPNNINGSLIKGYERIAGMMYNTLVTALKEHESSSAYSKAKLKINPYKIIADINEDSTTVLVDDLNPIATIKQTEDVSYLGKGGFNKETLARDSRVLNSSEVGVISESAKDNGDVGITAYLSAAPKLKTNRGIVDKFNIDQDGYPSVFSTSALLVPFSTTDDTKRLEINWARSTGM